MHTQSHELTFPQICGRCLQIHLQGTGNRLAVRRDSGHPILIEMVGEYVNEVVERTTIEPSLKSKKRIGDYMNPSLCKSKGEPK